MKSTTIHIVGQTVKIRYELYEHGYVEWTVDDTAKTLFGSSLLETLLRMHYNDFIEAQIREQFFFAMYEEQEAAAAHPPWPPAEADCDDDIPF